MKYLQNGNFLGLTSNTLQLENITITETEYMPERLDWHYHEHAYFTFILSGQLIEGNKKQQFQCPQGTLLFHNWQEPHYNIISKKKTRSLHLEIKKNLLNDYLPGPVQPEGAFFIDTPDIKLLFHQIYKETKLNESFSTLEIESLFLKAAGMMIPKSRKTQSKVPLWVNKIKDILLSKFSEKITLDDLSRELDIHPVHLSRDFSKYFNCSLGMYIRKIKIEKALLLLSDTELSLTDISFHCGFADQSHFLRCFKDITGKTPSDYRKILFR